MTKVNWRLEVDDGSGGTVDLTPHVENVDVMREHSALSDIDVRLHPTDKDAFDYNFQEIRLYVEGGLHFRGEVEEATNQYEGGSLDLYGRGIGLELTRGSSAITYQGVQPIYQVIQDYVADETTDWTWNVITPSSNTVSNAVNLDSAADGFIDGGSETHIVSGVVDSDPIIVLDSGVKLAQTCWTTEAEDASGGDSTLTDSNASGGEVNRLANNQIDVSFTPEYVVPDASGGEMNLAFRVKKVNGFDGDLFIDFDGTEVAGPYDSGIFNTSFSWHTDRAPITSDVAEGTSHTYSLRIDNRTQGSLDFDVLSPMDTRFTYDFDNSLDSNDALSGPQHYPKNGYEVQFDDTNYSFNLGRVEIDATWNDVSGNQQYRVSADNGSNYETRSNTADVDIDMDARALYGTQLDVLVTFDSFGTDTTTPTDGTSAQEITLYESTVTENDLNILEGSKRYEAESHLKNLQQMHRDAGMRFVIDHTVEGGLEAESFQLSDAPKQAGWTPVSHSETRETRDYYNEVLAKGTQFQNSEDRRSVTVTWDNEVTRVGETISGEEVFPGLDNLEDLRLAARRWLVEHIGNDVRSGDIRIVPQVTVPGYQYIVDRSVDRLDTDTIDVESVRFVLSQRNESGEVRFGRRGGSTELITGNRREIQDTKRVV